MLTESTIRAVRFWRFIRPLARTLLAVVIIVGGAERGPVRGEGQPRNIPKDGSWVRYQKESTSLTPVLRKKGPIQVTLSFVGSAVDEGDHCRWLERKDVIPEGSDGAGTYVYKVLVPEKDLFESENPFEHARRTWVRGPNGKISKAGEGVRDEMIFSDLLLWTPGLLKGSTAADDQAKDIEYQRGPLKAAQARTGKLVHRWRLQTATEVMYTKTYTAWQHPDLPIGFAEAHIEQDQFSQGRLTPISRFAIVYKIQDVGTDAKSELPDNE